MTAKSSGIDVLNSLHSMRSETDNIAYTINDLSGAFYVTGNVVMAKKLEQLMNQVSDLGERLDKTANAYVSDAMEQANESQRTVDKFVTTMVGALADGKLRGPA